jgi:SPOR domain
MRLIWYGMASSRRRRLFFRGYPERRAGIGVIAATCLVATVLTIWPARNDSAPAPPSTAAPRLIPTDGSDVEQRLMLWEHGSPHDLPLAGPGMAGRVAKEPPGAGVSASSPSDRVPASQTRVADIDRLLVASRAIMHDAAVLAPSKTMAELTTAALPVSRDLPNIEIKGDQAEQTAAPSTPLEQHRQGSATLRREARSTASRLSAADRSPARTRAAAHTTPLSDGGGKSAAVQLASLSSEAAARRHWDALRRRNVELLGSLKPRLRRVELGGGRTAFRVQAGPLAGRTDADRLCRALRDRAVDCLVIDG